jgi:branched-chain amino acid transport system permease protein
MDLLLSPQLLASALVQGTLYALLALGLNLIYGTMRLLNIAHGEIVMLGGYVVFWAFTLLGIVPLASMWGAAVLTALLGVALYRVMLRPMLASSALLARVEANSLLIFFGVSVIVQNLAALAFTASPRGFSYLDEIIEIGAMRVGADRLAVIVTGLAACLGAVALFRFTSLGLAIRAIIQQRDAAALVGIDIDRVNLVVCALGFGVAGLAGGLLAMVEQVSPFMGFPYTIAAFIVIILGGLGNLTGSLVGGLMLGLLETYGVAVTSASWRSILLYAVFITILLVRPEGLFGARAPRR